MNSNLFLFIFSSFLIIILSSLQIYSLVLLNKTNIKDNTQNLNVLKECKTLLLIIILIQILGLLTIIGILIFIYFKKKIFFNNTLLISFSLSCFILLLSGIFSIVLAVKLQCYKNVDKNIKNAWNIMTINSIMGIFFTIFLLLLYIFIKRNNLKNKTQQFLTDNNKLKKKVELDNIYENKKNNMINQLNKMNDDKKKIFIQQLKNKKNNEFLNLN